MTVLDEPQLVSWTAVGKRPASLPARRAPGPVRPSRPARVRPDIPPLQFRGSGAIRSHAVHTRRPVSIGVTFALAGLAALITLWLGCLAQFSSARVAPPPVSHDHLAVVQVQAGESLQHLAGRVAPDAPVGQIVARIKELNKLDSVAVDAGQTLIAPLG